MKVKPHKGWHSPKLYARMMQAWYNEQLAMLLVFEHWHPAVKRRLVNHV